jgi:phosphonate C-P lyase system protein PhnH
MTLDTQTVFRRLLDALSNPGRAVSITDCAAKFSANGEWLALAATLLDAEVTYYWNGGDSYGEELRFLTGSRTESPELADFALLPERVEPAAFISRIKSGTHLDPHLSAILIIGSSGEREFECALSGPGVPPNGRALMVTEYEREWIHARDAARFEYPLGIELIFVRDGGVLAAITRKAAVAWHM